MAISTSSRVEPRSQYVTDSSLQPFLQRELDSADYLNRSLPPLSTSAHARTGAGYGHTAVPLSEISSHLQTLLSQLNAQTTRLSNTLTQLTDEIIRSGGRLAYEVDVLKGETSGLTEAMEHHLEEDIALFVPSGDSRQSIDSGSVTAHKAEGVEEDVSGPSDTLSEPEYLEKLRTLAVVRSRLESVIQVFGDAMAWPIAPSETSSLISVSAPEPDADVRIREEKGKEWVENLRKEISELVGPGNDAVALDAAAARIEELRQLAGVWKGTAEEKARLRLVESLQKPIGEKQKALVKTGESRKPGTSPSRGYDLRYGNMDPTRTVNEGGYGFLQNLRTLKNEVYLE